MSVENRPNLNAVGLTVAILGALETYIRGNARKAGIDEVYRFLTPDITEFVETVNEQLDKKFGM